MSTNVEALVVFVRQHTSRGFVVRIEGGRSGPRVLLRVLCSGIISPHFRGGHVLESHGLQPNRERRRDEASVSQGRGDRRVSNEAGAKGGKDQARLS